MARPDDAPAGAGHAIDAPGGPDHEPRLFFAVPLPEAPRAAVSQLVTDVRGLIDGPEGSQRRPVRWVRLDGLHLTLRFLGPTPGERLHELGAIVEEVAAATPTFPIGIRGGGAFPNPARPRALWLGIDDGAAPLADMAARLDARLEAAGWPHDDRPFRVHLTLGRTDGVRIGPRAARTLIELAADFSAGFDADRLVLFESLTGGGPARYVPRHEARLAAPEPARSPA